SSSFSFTWRGNALSTCSATKETTYQTSKCTTAAAVFEQAIDLLVRHFTLLTLVDSIKLGLRIEIDFYPRLDFFDCCSASGRVFKIEIFFRRTCAGFITSD